MENSKGKGSNGGEATYSVGATLSDTPQSDTEIAAFGGSLGKFPLTKRAFHEMKIELGESIPPRYMRGFRRQAEEFGRQLMAAEASQIKDLVAEAIENDRIEAEAEEMRTRLEDSRPDPIALPRVRCQNERDGLVCGREFAPKIQNILGWVDGQLVIKTHREGEMAGKPVIAGAFVIVDDGGWKGVRAYCPQHIDAHRRMSEDGRSFSFERATSIVELLNERRAAFEEREAIRAARAALAGKATSQLMAPPEVIVASNLPVNMAVQVIETRGVDRHAAREDAKRARRAVKDPFFKNKKGAKTGKGKGKK